MAKINNLAIFKTLSEILRNVDVVPNPNDVHDVLDRPYCWGATQFGHRCRKHSCGPKEKEQIRSLWYKFQIMTECPDTDEFYDQMETFVALTHCMHHCDRALDAFTAWKAKRQAALNSPPFASSANEVSNNQQEDDSSEILYDGTNVNSLDSILVKDEELHQEKSCPICNKSFTQSRSLQRHIWVFHTKFHTKDGELRNEKSCPNCDKSFTRPDNLRRHISEFHAEDGEFLCSHSGCERSKKGKGFKRLVEWEDHANNTCRGRTRSPSSFEQVIALQEEVGKSPTDESSGNSLGMTQEVQTNIIAPPATDSGYESTSATESKFGMLMRHEDMEQPTRDIPDQDMSDTATEYSDESRSTVSKKQGFVRELANELFKAVSSLNANEMIQARVSNSLPELLQAFALKVGYGAKTQMHRDVMAFVYRHRR